MISFARALGFLRELVVAVRAFRLDDGIGLPPADSRWERAGRRMMIGATVLLGAVGLWEIAAPFAAGHYAASTAVALAGENMWHFGVIAPVPRYLPGPPSPSDYYCHHPFGMFWTAALFSGVFGHHDWVCRLPAVLMSTSMPWLIHRAVRATWGPAAGGLAALMYAVLPITLAYAAFFALEVPTMFGMALGTWALVRFFQAGTNRYAVFTLLGFGYAACVDWPGVLFAGLVLGGLLFRGFVLRRFFEPVPFERFAALWASLVALLAVILLFHAAAIAKLDQLGELMRQGEFRALGADRPLDEVLASRAYWIALAFTPLAIGLGKVAAPLLAVRLAVRRTELELIVLALLATAIFQYVVFKQGADIHFFWPQYFALYAAYAAGALAVTLEEGVRRHFPRLAAAGLAPGLGVALILGSVAAILPEGLGALLYARKTGGRFNEKGLIIHPDVDKQAALAKVAETLPDDAFVGLDGSMKQMYWMDWTLRRPVGPMPFPKLGQALRQSHFALDLRFAAPAQAASLVEQFQTQAFGPYLVADLRAVTTPLEGHALVPREPTLLQRLFVSSSHALYDIVPDPFLTWELRHHFDRASAAPPAAAPRGPEQLRIAHNVAVLAGDMNGAAKLRERLLAGTERRVARDYTDGVSLLGWRFETGASDFFTVYFEARRPLRANYPFGITSHVEEALKTITPPDDKAWDVGMPFVIPTTLWVEGFIYAAVTEILGRPGRERYDGAFRGRGAPVPVEGPAEVTLFTR